MKILVISQYYYPEDFRINDICEELVRRGNQVTVVTGIPNYPEGVVYKGYEQSYNEPEKVNGVEIIRCHNRPRKKGVINLLLNYISYYKKATKIVKKLSGNYDMVYAYQMSPVMQVIPAIKYKKKHRIPLFVYVCDLWPASILDLGKKRLSTSSVVYKYFLNISKRVYKQADFIGAKCEEFIDYLENVCNVDRKKCSVIYEHAESNYLNVSNTPIDNGVVDFMYLGNVGHSSNCDLIIKATSMLVGENFKVHFVGDGSELENIKELTTELNLNDKVVFHGRCPQKDTIDFYNLADVCLLSLSNDPAVGMTPPAKLTGYMAACRPIVASVCGAAKKIIMEAKCGLICTPNNVEELSALMQSIINDQSILDNLGINGRNYYKEHFTIERHIDELLRAFQRFKTIGVFENENCSD